jgi:hypothetical protein
MQRRFVFSGKLEDIEHIKTDVAIVGSGAAGLFTALHLDKNLDCIILDKLGPEVCNSMYAQGGIAVVLPQSIGDSPDKHYQDTLTAGAGLCDKDAVRVLVDEGAECIRDRYVEIITRFLAAGIVRHRDHLIRNHELDANVEFLVSRLMPVRNLDDDAALDDIGVNATQTLDPAPGRRQRELPSCLRIPAWSPRRSL